VTEPFRSGFACLLGRPNTGKSTLTNALVGSKVAITSDRPQTTRHAVRGIVTRPDAQLVVVDTPGFHRPRTLLGERLNDLVRATLTEVDVVMMCVPATDRVGPGDRFIAKQLRESAPRVPAIAVVSKCDIAGRDAIGERLLEVSALGEWDEVVPVSAVTGYQMDLLSRLLAARLPEGPPLYPTGELTDSPELLAIAELIREAALATVREELPHSIAVTVDDTAERDDLLEVHAVLHVERDSQKGIVIGSGGERLRTIGTVARRQIEVFVGRQVYLDLRVKVAKDWQRDPKQLNKLGF
jgi:GTP-binding protein Era